jgi:hypothetical protein
MKLVKIYGGYRNTSDVINSMIVKPRVEEQSTLKRKKRSSSRLIIQQTESMTRKDGSLMRKSLKISDDQN